MAKSSNIVKPNLLLHNTKVSYLISCTLLEVHQYYHGYIVKVNAKNSATYVNTLCGYCIHTNFWVPYSSKFSWSNIFMIFVNYTEITKIFDTKIFLQHP